MPGRTRVYSYLLTTALCALGAAGATSGGAAPPAPELDCAHPAEARAFIARLELAEIEGAEDIHRAAMWEAFGRCPGGGAGEPCRGAERRRFEARWKEMRREIEARYRRMLGAFEQRCRGVISLIAPGA